MNHPAHQYAEQVHSGELDACEPVRLACARYLDDLQRPGLVFNESKARQVLHFFETILVHTVGQYAGKPFELLPWQAWILWNLYGWHMPDGSRRFNTAYVSMARKQGKTTLAAGVALTGLLLDQEPAAEVYSAATKRDQARILFEEARRMILRSSALAKHLTPGRHVIECPALGGKLTALSSDASTLDGLNPSTAIIDEYHSHPTDEVANVIRSGMQARRNPLHLTITTAGMSTAVPCYALHRTCMEVLRGQKTDDHLFAVMYQLDEDDAERWADPSTWHKANPSLGHTITLDALRKQYTQAKNIGRSAEIEFRTKHLNQWTSQASTWIRDAEWTACKSEATPSGACWAGLDLAAVSDLTALVLVWPQGTRYVIRGEYWIPRDTVRAELQKNPAHIYSRFLHLPNFHQTDGNVTDFAAIRRRVTGMHLTPTGMVCDSTSLMHLHQVQKIAFDRHNSTQIAIDLTDDGAPLAPYGQGFVSMSPGAKQVEHLIRSGKLAHDGDPVLRWAFSNVNLRTDPAGNIKPDKSKSGGKIDPVVALCMAVGEHMRQGPQLTDDMLQVVTL